MTTNVLLQCGCGEGLEKEIAKTRARCLNYHNCNIVLYDNLSLCSCKREKQFKGKGFQLYGAFYQVWLIEVLYHGLCYFWQTIRLHSFYCKNILHKNIEATISEILICSECTRCIFFSIN